MISLPAANVRPAIVCTLTLGGLLLGCRPPVDHLPSGHRDLIQSRVTNSFARTVLFKPIEAESNPASVLRLAPLIIQDVAGTNNSVLWRDRFAPEDAGPLVHAGSGTITVNGRPHDQFSYLWTYPATGPGRDAQGIRITLNAAGEPVIWEVLGDSTGADILYVAQSVELAARAEFGPPPPGRKFSIERNVGDAPRTVVANIIDDGPTPMGPVVYLMKDNRDVSTLICRCMASQGGLLLGQADYALETSMAQTNLPAAFPTIQLEQRLRLPRSF